MPDSGDKLAAFSWDVETAEGQQHLLALANALRQTGQVPGVAGLRRVVPALGAGEAPDPRGRAPHPHTRHRAEVHRHKAIPPPAAGAAGQRPDATGRGALPGPALARPAHQRPRCRYQASPDTCAIPESQAGAALG